GGPYWATYCDTSVPHERRPLSGYSSSMAVSINNFSYVVGWSWTPGGGSFQDAQATLWDGAGPHALGHLSGDASSKAWSINDSNWVVGESYNYSGTETHRAFFYSAGTGMYGICADPGYGSSSAY